jgi:hypothetical protein
MEDNNKLLAYYKFRRRASIEVAPSGDPAMTMYGYSSPCQPISQASQPESNHDKTHMGNMPPMLKRAWMMIAGIRLPVFSR